MHESPQSWRITPEAVAQIVTTTGEHGAELDGARTDLLAVVGLDAHGVPAASAEIDITGTVASALAELMSEHLHTAVPTAANQIFTAMLAVQDATAAYVRADDEMSDDASAAMTAIDWTPPAASTFAPVHNAPDPFNTPSATDYPLGSTVATGPFDPSRFSSNPLAPGNKS